MTEDEHKELSFLEKIIDYILDFFVSVSGCAM
jgi:hypothetical protein